MGIRSTKFWCAPDSVQFQVVPFFLTFVSISDRRGSIHRLFCCNGIMAHRDFRGPVRV